MTLRRLRVLALLAVLASLGFPPWTPAHADEGPGYVVTVSGALTAADRATLEASLASAVAAFRQAVGPLARPVVVRVGDGALTTGYSAERDEVGFPASGELIANGVRSADVVRHEMFHAMACQFPEARAAAQGDDDARALHEGLADFFAHALAPDDHFGEGYYTDRPYVRNYTDGLCYALARGSHARGQAVCGFLLDAGYTLDDVGRFLRARTFTRAALLALHGGGGSCFSEREPPAVDATPRNYPASMLSKFVLDPGAPLELEFAANAPFARDLGALDVTWPSGTTVATFERLPSARGVVWRVTGVPGAKPAKVIAHFRAGGKIVGFQPFYFRVK